jgi:toxin CcdB
VIDIAGEPFVIVTQFAAAVHVRELGERVATLANHHETITAALDLLITGV